MRKRADKPAEVLPKAQQLLRHMLEAQEREAGDLRNRIRKFPHSALQTRGLYSSASFNSWSG